MTVLIGASPIRARPCSPELTITAPWSLLMSTEPSRTVTKDSPSVRTSTTNSVPRMAAVTAGVRTRTRAGTRFERNQAFPDSRLRMLCSAPAATWLTLCSRLLDRRTCRSCSLALGPIFSCVSSARRRAARLRTAVRTTAPGARGWSTRAGTHPGVSSWTSTVPWTERIFAAISCPRNGVEENKAKKPVQ